jgi:hypothetical protein
MERPPNAPPTALWISARGLATGYHATDKLTPDGALRGFKESDFERGFTPTFEIEIGDHARQIFDTIRTPEWAALEATYQHPGINDGFALRVSWTLDGGDLYHVWMCNTDYPLIAGVVRAVWRHVPGRVFPELPPWQPTWHVIPRRRN